MLSSTKEKYRTMTPDFFCTLLLWKDFICVVITHCWLVSITIMSAKMLHTFYLQLKKVLEYFAEFHLKTSCINRSSEIFMYVVDQLTSQK